MITLIDNYIFHFKRRMEQYKGMMSKNPENEEAEKFYQEYYGYLRVLEDIRAHILAGKEAR